MSGYGKQYGEKSLSNEGAKPEIRSQERLSNLIDQLGKFPLFNGVLIKNIDLSSTPKLINHKLGREYQGFIVTDSNSAFNSIFSTSGTHDKKLFIRLVSSGNVTAQLWIF